MAAKKRTAKPAAKNPPIMKNPRAARAAKRPPGSAFAPEPASKATSKLARPGCPVVGIGASAGGLDAFKKFLGAMPRDSGIVFLLIPHLAPTHKSLMVELLAKCTAMPVVEAGEAMAVEANHIYIIPPNQYLAISDGTLRLTGPMEPGSSQTAIDSFLCSLAEDQQERAIGIILSGTGSHGMLGLKAIKAHGGMTMVQDPATAEFDRMPQSAIAGGLADYVLPPEKMPAALIQYVRHPHVRGGELPEATEETSKQLDEILALLRTRTKHDFRCYRKKMPLRRVQRRMGLHQIDALPQYLAFLRKHPEEIQQLARDLLISVTNFFRDPEAFHALESHVVPELIHGRDADASLRVWVPGCATGEEAYSLAMLLLESLTAAQQHIRLQVFATDIDEFALEVARHGIYSESIMADVSAERLARFFIKTDGHSYQVNKQLREAVTFAVQNLIGDAPFSKLDLVSCRNVLIYLEPDVQQKVIAVLHFALKESGYLLLGPSETIGTHVNLFEVVVKKWHVFRRIGRSRPDQVDIPIVPGSESLAARNRLTGLAGPRPEAFGEFARQLLFEDFAPAAVLIDRKHEVLYFHGPTSLYLEQLTGAPTRNLLLLARDGLRTKLRTTINQALNQRQRVSLAHVRIKRNGSECAVRLTVKPVDSPKSAEGLLLVTFEDEREPAPSRSVKSDVSLDESLVRQLENELDATRQDLQTTIEEMESSNEQLKASNEEVMSVNEELQSANEELETSKEELQSLNEELNTVNSQLREKVEELEQTNNDLANLFSSTDVATIFLDTRFRIERFTEATSRLFNLIATDVGRPLGDIAPKFTDAELLRDSQEVLRTLIPREKEVQTHEGRWFLRRILPYRTLNDKIDGVVITFADVTLVRQTIALRESRDRLAAVMDSAREGLVTIDEHGVIDSFNKTAEKLFGYQAEEVVGKKVNVLMPSPYREAQDDYLANYRETGLKKIIGIGREVLGRRKDGTTFPIALSVSELRFESRQLFAGLIRDISERKALEKEVLDIAAFEQRRIGQELHDSVGQELTGLGLLAGSLVESLANRSDPDQQLAVQLASGVKRIFGQIRSLSRGLALPGVNAAGLTEALRQLASSIRAHSDVTCTFSGAEMPQWDDDFSATHLYRIAQEAVTNAIQHAAAKHIRISLEAAGQHATLRVSDDGIGIQDHTESSDGAGLRIMRYRADLINAVLSIDHAHGGGTAITCTFIRDMRHEQESADHQ